MDHIIEQYNRSTSRFGNNKEFIDIYHLSPASETQSINKIFTVRHDTVEMKATQYIWYVDEEIFDFSEPKELKYHQIKVDSNQLTEKLKYLTNMLLFAKYTNNHINFLKVKDIFRDPSAVQPDRIIMEPAYRSLPAMTSYLKWNNSVIHADVMHEIFRELMDAVSFLHDNKIGHGWITPEAIVCKTANSFIPIALVDMGQYELCNIDTNDPQHPPTKFLMKGNLTYNLPPELIMGSIFRDKPNNDAFMNRFQNLPAQRKEEFKTMLSLEEIRQWMKAINHVEYQNRMDVYMLAQTMYCLMKSNLPFYKREYLIPREFHTGEEEACMSNCTGCLFNQYFVQRACHDGTVRKWRVIDNRVFLYYGTHHAIFIAMGLNFQPEDRPKLKDFLKAYTRLSSENPSLEMFMKVGKQPTIELCADYERRPLSCRKPLRQSEEYFRAYPVQRPLVLQEIGCQAISGDRVYRSQEKVNENNPIIDQLSAWASRTVIAPPELILVGAWEHSARTPNTPELNQYHFDPFNQGQAAVEHANLPHPHQPVPQHQLNPRAVVFNPVHATNMTRQQWGPVQQYSDLDQPLNMSLMMNPFNNQLSSVATNQSFQHPFATPNIDPRNLYGYEPNPSQPQQYAQFQSNTLPNHQLCLATMPNFSQPPPFQNPLEQLPSQMVRPMQQSMQQHYYQSQLPQQIPPSGHPRQYPNQRYPQPRYPY